MLFNLFATKMALRRQEGDREGKKKEDGEETESQRIDFYKGPRPVCVGLGVPEVEGGGGGGGKEKKKKKKKEKREKERKAMGHLLPTRGSATGGEKKKKEWGGRSSRSSKGRVAARALWRDEEEKKKKKGEGKDMRVLVLWVRSYFSAAEREGEQKTKGKGRGGETACRDRRGFISRLASAQGRGEGGRSREIGGGGGRKGQKGELSLR